MTAQDNSQDIVWSAFRTAQKVGSFYYYLVELENVPFRSIYFLPPGYAGDTQHYFYKKS